MLDYIIVGFGLAGLSFSEQLYLNDKSFVVISERTNSSSVVAGGMYNPVILKRFTSPWNAVSQLDYAVPFYKNIEERLGISVLFPFPVLRVFNSIEEQNNWLIASDKTKLSSFLSLDFVANNNTHINANNSLGEVKNAGRLVVSDLLDVYSKDLQKSNSFINASFNFSNLHWNGVNYVYQGLEAKNILFCEGFGLKQNPFFNYLPLNGTKGEVLIIKAPNLNLTSIIKSGIFIIPLEVADTYLIGATYEWDDKSWNVTTNAKNELIAKLDLVINCSYEIIDQLAGIRPTVKDRRPLVGKHPVQPNMYVLNGLGTRGVMVGPSVSKQLFDAIETDTKLDDEIDISRFHNLFKPN